jgi:transposase-like protein
VMSMAEIRLEVLLEAARSGETVTEVCRRHGISRGTYYVYLRRYQAEGQGLEPRSRQPQHQPVRMAAELELQICRLRKDHRWGARRIGAELGRAGKAASAVSSVHQALVRNHMVALRPPRPNPSTLASSGSRPTTCGRSTPPGWCSALAGRPGSWTSSMTTPGSACRPSLAGPHRPGRR